MNPRARVLSAFARWMVSVVVVASSTLALAHEVILGSVPLSANRNLILGRPVQRHPAEPEVLLSRTSYVASWSPERRGPNWVAWELRQEDLQGVNRRKSFATDPELSQYLRSLGSRAVSPSEFVNTCFDRGHQVPSADRTTSSPEAPSTFYMSNVLPQTAWLNRIEWRNLETFERKLVREQGKRLVVFSGGIFDDAPRTIGPRRDIAVPSHNFKIIVVLERGEDLAHVTPQSPMLVLKFPNLNSDGSDPFENPLRTCEDHDSQYDRPPETWPASDSWVDYSTSLAEIESLTGYEFFRGNSWIDELKTFGLPRL